MQTIEITYGEPTKDKPLEAEPMFEGPVGTPMTAEDEAQNIVRSTGAVQRAKNMLGMMQGMDEDYRNAVLQEWSTGTEGANYQQLTANDKTRVEDQYNSELNTLQGNPALFSDPQFKEKLMRVGAQADKWKGDKPALDSLSRAFLRDTAAQPAKPNATRSERAVLAKQQAAAKRQALLTTKDIERIASGSEVTMWAMAKNLGTYLVPGTGTTTSINENSAVEGVTKNILGKKFGYNNFDEAFPALRSYVLEGKTAKEQATRLDKVAKEYRKQMQYLGKDAYDKDIVDAKVYSFIDQLATEEGKFLGVETDDFAENASWIGDIATFLPAAGAVFKTGKAAIRKLTSQADNIAVQKIYGKDEGPVNMALTAAEQPKAITVGKGTPVVAEKIKPQGYNSLRKGQDKATLDYLEQLRAKSDMVVNNTYAGVYDTPLQKAVQAKVTAEAEEFAIGVTRTDMTTMKEADELGFSHEVFYGHTPSAGFATKAQADEFAEATGKSGELFYRDIDTDELLPVTSKDFNEEDAAEFFIKETKRYDYKPDDFAMFGEKPVLRTYGSANLSDILTDPASRFLPRAMNVMRKAINRKELVAAKLAELYRPIGSLNYVDQYAVSRALSDGDAQGKVFSKAEFTVQYPEAGKNAYKGYMAGRVYMDTLYRIANRSQRTQLEREGYQTLVRPNGETVLSKEVDVTSIDANAKVWSDDLGRVLDKTEVELALTAKAGKVLRTREAVQNPTGQLHDLVYVSNSGKSQLSSTLPLRVLNYNEGQITRVYDENYFVREVFTTQVNGIDKQAERVVAAAQTKKEADRIAANLRAQGKTILDPQPDAKALRAITENLDDSVDIGGALFLSQRGPRLLRPEVDGGLARIMDPLKVFDMTRNVAANRTVFNEAIQAMEVVGLKSYPNFLRRLDNGALELKAGDETSREYRHAKSFLTWLQGMKIDEAQQRATTLKYTTLRLVENSERLSRVVGATANAVGDPVNLLKKGGYFVQVASAPIRQLTLNALQTAMLFGQAPIATTRALLLDSWVLTAAQNIKNNDTLYNMYKRMGGSTSSQSELAQLAVAFEKSGLGYTVGQNNVFGGRPVVGNTPVSKVGAAARATKDALTAATFGVTKQGELINHAGTFAVAYRKMKEANPNLSLTNDADIAAIGAKARAMMPDMTKINNAGIEQGMAGLAFQYTSYLLKSTYMATIGTEFSKAQKAMLALGAIAIYGNDNTLLTPMLDPLVDSSMAAMGVTYNSLSDKLFDGAVDAQTFKNYLEGGLLDGLYNDLLTDNGDVVVSGAASPYTGFRTFVSTFGGFFEPNGQVAIKPPIAGVFSTFGKVSESVEALFTPVDAYKDPSTYGQAINVIGGGLISQWGKYNAAQVGLALDATVTGNNKTVTRADMDALWSKGVFGFTTRREAEAYTMGATQKAIDADRKVTVAAHATLLRDMFIRGGRDLELLRNKEEQVLLGLLAAYGNKEEAYSIYNDALAAATDPIMAAEFGLSDAKDKTEQAAKGFWTGIFKGKVPTSQLHQLRNSQWYLDLKPEDRQSIDSFAESMKEREE